MGIDRAGLNARQRELIDPRDREALKLEVSQATHQRKLNRLEKDEQNQLANWLKIREEEGVLVYDWSRMDKRTTSRRGMPDFKIYARGRALFGEMKIVEGRLAEVQIEMIARLSSSGNQVEIWHSGAQAIEAVREWLFLT